MSSCLLKSTILSIILSALTCLDSNGLDSVPCIFVSSIFPLPEEGQLATWVLKPQDQTVTQPLGKTADDWPPSPASTNPWRPGVQMCLKMKERLLLLLVVTTRYNVLFQSSDQVSEKKKQWQQPEQFTGQKSHRKRFGNFPGESLETTALWCWWKQVNVPTMQRVWSDLPAHLNPLRFPTSVLGARLVPCLKWIAVGYSRIV